MPMESLIAALISGAVTLTGVLIANGKSQAVTDTRLEELAREVRRHNDFAERIPTLETENRNIDRRLTDLERKTDQLESFHTRP